MQQLLTSCVTNIISVTSVTLVLCGCLMTFMFVMVMQLLLILLLVPLSIVTVVVLINAQWLIYCTTNNNIYLTFFVSIAYAYHNYASLLYTPITLMVFVRM